MALSNLMNRRKFLELSSFAIASFYFKSSFSQEKDKENEIIIGGTGDVTLGGSFPEMFNSLSQDYGEERAFKFPFEKVYDYFLNSDINIVNLEGALTTSDKVRPKKFNFKGDPKYTKCLREGGINIVNIANNHIMDFYEEGALDTISALNDFGIEYCGAGKDIEDASMPRFFERKGVKVGFLGYAFVGADYPARNNSAGTNVYDPLKIKSQICEAKDNCDLLVVSTHWGVEREYFPNNGQRNFGKIFIDNGADIVFSHHPHVLQGIEKYQNGIIFYSLGNFVFGGNSFPSDRDSIIARVKCNKNGILDFEIVPIVTHPRVRVFQPYVPKDILKIKNKLQERSKLFLNKEIKLLI